MSQKLQVARITSRLETLEDIATKRANAGPASAGKQNNRPMQIDRRARRSSCDSAHVNMPHVSTSTEPPMTRLLINVHLREILESDGRSAMSGRTCSCGNKHLREILESDGRSGWLRPEQSKVETVEVTNSIGHGSNELFFRTAVRIPKTLCVDPSEAKLLAVSFLREWLPTHLSRANYLNFYGLGVEDYKDALRAEKGAITLRSEVAVTPTEALVRSMEEVHIHNRAVGAKFAEAKEALTDWAFHNTPYGFQSTLGQARRHFQTLEDVLDCSAAAGGYSASDARHAYRCYEDLAGRKLSNNRNYQAALGQLQRIVSGMHFPDVWGRRPEYRI